MSNPTGTKLTPLILILSSRLMAAHVEAVSVAKGNLTKAENTAIASLGDVPTIQSIEAYNVVFRASCALTIAEAKVTRSNEAHATIRQFLSRTVPCPTLAETLEEMAAFQAAVAYVTAEIAKFTDGAFEALAVA